MSKILVVYHTFTGNTAKLAEVLAEGVRGVEGTEVVVKKATDTVPEDLQNLDAVAIGAPNTFGGMAGAMRHFFDRMWPVREQTEGRPAVIFTSENEGQTGAIDEIRKFFSFFKLKEVSEGVTATAPVEGKIDECRKLGRALGEASLK